MRRHKSAGAERRRTDIAFALGVAVAMAGIAFLVVTMQGLSRDLRTANEARDALARQVERLGESPVAGPPGSRGQPGASVVGPPGRRATRASQGRSVRLALWARAATPAPTVKTAHPLSAHLVPRAPRVRTGSPS
ncbi:hypothetical protein [Streptomyces sp. BE133]|uniref:hypothetical protein n=1 Tax=Streptomyces sp. BE133 TaxID=3002523 RepID=UPI002E7997ED|nr:hypothetical protein [Streptomyces sp. BE133]MEE1808057.1 hypothetical protein [Streptomyces sp. BE133]